MHFGQYPFIEDLDELRDSSGLKLLNSLIEDDHATPVALPQLNIGVQQLDATDRAIGSQVHIDRVAHPNGLHLGGLGMETDVGNVVSRIVGQFHGSVSPPR